MKTRHLIITAAMSALVATPAAAEVAGPRVEAVLGYDSVDVGVSGIDDAEGVVYGLGVGYDFALDSTVSLGIDAEVSDSSADVEFGPFEAEAERDLYLGARATFATSEAFNIYVKAGYTNLKVKVSGFGTSASDNGDGFRAALGGQYNLGKVYIGAEYRYSDYEQGVTRNQVVGVIGTRF